MEITNEEIIKVLRCTNKSSDCLDCDLFIFCYSPREEVKTLLADRLEKLIEPEDDWECK